MRAYAMELIGTFFLMLAVSWTGNPIAIGAMLGILVYIGAQVSGGHYNPAVTTAMFFQKKVSAIDSLFYMIAQILGAFFATAYFTWVTKSSIATTPADIPVMRIFSVELLFTFLLCITIVTITGAAYKNTGVTGLVIGWALMVVAFCGGTYNPALSLGPTLLALFHGMSEGIGNSWVYIVAPLAGGAAASFLSDYLETK